jgi:hypothetical protein
MSTASVFRIVTQTLQKRKVAAKWVPHQLSEGQKEARKRGAEKLLGATRQKVSSFSTELLP